jgi:restriction system protein
MPIPKFDEMYRPLLDCLKDGKECNFKDVKEIVASRLGITADERMVLIKSGKAPKFDDRISWTRTYLKKAGLLTSATRGWIQITPEGLKVLNNYPGVIDNEYLMKYQSFREFRKIEGPFDNEPARWTEGTPQDMLDNAYAIINSKVADELLSEIMKQTPAFFEQMVVELLVKMGYGGTLEEAGTVVGRSGDEGIDGIIREDKLGFNFIYIQAKRWDINDTIGRPEINKFVGALAGVGATKGLFITTARFSKEAVEYVSRHLAARIVLVDGMKLTNLMIEYNLGVTLVNSYNIKKVDTDYFTGDSI